MSAIYEIYGIMSSVSFFFRKNNENQKPPANHVTSLSREIINSYCVISNTTPEDASATGLLQHTSKDFLEILNPFTAIDIKEKHTATCTPSRYRDGLFMYHMGISIVKIIGIPMLVKWSMLRQAPAQNSWNFTKVISTPFYVKKNVIFVF